MNVDRYYLGKSVSTLAKQYVLGTWYSLNQYIESVKWVGKVNGIYVLLCEVLMNYNLTHYMCMYRL